jgi:TonB family protein
MRKGSMRTIGAGWICAPVCALGALWSMQATAACERPKAQIEVPQGDTATEADMAQAQQQILALDQRVGDYLRCIKGETSQQTVGKDEATRKRLMEQYVADHNAAAAELSGLANCYTAQMEKFRSSGGGKARKAADCSAYMTPDASMPAPGGTPLPSSLVKEADGYSYDLADGKWSYTLIRDERPRRCGAKMDQECVQRSVWVVNNTGSTLECKAYVAYEGTDADGQARTESQAVVVEKSLRSVVNSLAPRGVNAQTFEAQCKPRAPLPPLATKAECKFQVVKPVNISDYYPASARRLGEEGPVTLEFTVGNKPGNPSNVKVVESSLSSRLDQGAVEAVSAMVMTSACRNERHRMRMSFRLEE